MTEIYFLRLTCNIVYVTQVSGRLLEYSEILNKSTPHLSMSAKYCRKNKK